MEIIHIAWNLSYGGAETLLTQLLNLQCLSNDVILIIVNNAVEDALEKQIDPKVKIIKINRPLKSKNPVYFIKLSWILLSLKSDIIHFHQDNLIEYVPVRVFKKNFCLTVHSVAMDVKSLHKYNYLFAISESVQKQVLNKCGLESTLIYNGINVSGFKIKDFRERKNRKFHIVQIGRLDHMVKGQDLLIKAVAILVGKNHKNFSISIIGEGNSKDYLQSLIDKLSLSAYITLEGNKTFNYIRDNLCQYDLLVQPSRYEGFGLVAVEGMSAKVPVLVSNVDGLEEIIRQNQYGYSFEKENVEDFANKIEYILECPSEKLEIQTEQAYQYVLNQFDISITSNNYLNVYKNIIGKK